MWQMGVESARLTPHCSEFFNRPIPIPISGPFPPLCRLPAHCAFRAGSLTTSNLKLPACPGQCGHISRSKITSSARFGVVWPFGGCGVNWRVTNRFVADDGLGGVDATGKKQAIPNQMSQKPTRCMSSHQLLHAANQEITAVGLYRNGHSSLRRRQGLAGVSFCFLKRGI